MGSVALRQPRVLVVDDDPMVRRVLGRVLHDYDVICLGLVRDALALIDRGEHVDVILSDVMMPEMTGVDFFHALRARDPLLAKRLIFMTGGVPNPAIGRALAAIPNLKLDKPTPRLRLRDAIQLMLVG